MRDIICYSNPLLSIQFSHEHCVCNISQVQVSAASQLGSACARGLSSPLENRLTYQVKELLADPSYTQVLSLLMPVEHRWASTSAFTCQRYPTSDIDISYSDIGTKYVGLNTFILLSKEFRYRHPLPFRYRTKSILDILISKIDKSFPNGPRKIL